MAVEKFLIFTRTEEGEAKGSTPWPPLRSISRQNKDQEALPLSKTAGGHMRRGNDPTRQGRRPPFSLWVSRL